MRTLAILHGNPNKRLLKSCVVTAHNTLRFRSGNTAYTPFILRPNSKREHTPRKIRVYTGQLNRNLASEFKSTQESLEPPQNLKVQVTAEGYLVTWDPPSNANIKLYVVRWFRGSTDEHLHGRAETTDTFYLIKSLEEESSYIFEVSAMSQSDDVATSEQFTLEVPAYRRNRAISMGIVAGVGFLAAALAAIWWSRKRFCQPTMNK